MGGGGLFVVVVVVVVVVGWPLWVVFVVWFGCRLVVGGVESSSLEFLELRSVELSVIDDLSDPTTRRLSTPRMPSHI